MDQNICLDGCLVYDVTVRRQTRLETFNYLQLLWIMDIDHYNSFLCDFKIMVLNGFTLAKIDICFTLEEVCTLVCACLPRC